MTPQNKPDLPDPEQVRLINALEYARQVRREIQAASGDVGGCVSFFCRCRLLIQGPTEWRMPPGVIGCWTPGAIAFW
jgi:hypothetical protein